MNSETAMVNAFTVDVEDYFQVSGFESSIQRKDWAGYESRVVGNTYRILDLMNQHDIRGTFFMLGWVAKRYPELVEEIHCRGHEVGSHSFWHHLVYQQSPKEFREDLQRSRDVIEDTIGVRVKSYRAPSFSITQKSTWALEILIEEGFQFDSSVFPVHHDRYGIPNAQRGPHVLNTPSGTIWEFPPTVKRVAGVNLPVGGGGYFRLFPAAWTNFWLASVQQNETQPAMFYIHPWEIDPLQPRLKAGGRMSRFRHYVNLSRTEQKLKRLFNSFSFGSLYEALTRHRIMHLERRKQHRTQPATRSGQSSSPFDARSFWN